MTVVLIGLLFVLLCLSALSSVAETSLFSLSPLTVRSYHNNADPRLKLIAKLLANPRDLLVTILILNVCANLLVQNTVSTLFESSSFWIVKVGIPLALTLIFGEVLPKSIAMPNNAAIAYRVAPWIHWITRSLRWIREPLTRATSWISRFIFFMFAKEKKISAEELRHVLQTSQQSGVLLPQECDLIEGALDLECSHIKELMRPREEILFYDVQDPLDRLLHLLVDLEITRVPVCDGQLDRLLGILSTKNFFFQQEKIQTSADLHAILKKPYYVPEAMKSWSLLKSLREKGESLAIVVDEYGSISGLVTQEDLIESVVGEISDRRDMNPIYTRSSEDVVIASGKLELSEFQDIFAIALKSEEGIVTLGGWLVEQLGDIPIVGTKYATDQFLFYVLEADPNRVRRIYVRKLGKKV